VFGKYVQPGEQPENDQCDHFVKLHKFSQ